MKRTTPLCLSLVRVGLRLWVWLAVALSAPAIAGSVTVTGSSTITAESNALWGELELTLQSHQPIYGAEIVAIGDSGGVLHHDIAVWQPAQLIKVPFRLERKHRDPGRYHLLVEIRLRDRANSRLSVNLYFPYVYQRSGVRPAGPLLSIEGNRVNWGDVSQTGGVVNLELTTGPHWRLSKPLSFGVDTLELERLPGASPQPRFVYNQLAVLNWLGSDGYHYSRVIPWGIQTDSNGKWIQRPDKKLFGAIQLQGQPILVGWLVCLLGIGLRGAWLLHRRQADRVPNLLGWGGVLALTLWLAGYTHPELWLTTTWPTGGDLASHVLYVDKFREWLLTGKITGWMPEVFAGFPAFRYYFPLPFILCTLLSLVLPLQVAIKLVAMLPSLLVPAAVYWMGGRFQWTVGMRLFAALFSTGFLVHGASSVWGGNLLSQLSGEFSYSWGLLLTLVFWGCLVWALRHGGRSWWLPAVVEVLVGLSHGYSLLIAGFSALLLPLFYQQRAKALLTVLKIHLAAFLLLGFWLLPLIENLPLTIPNDTAVWVKNVNTFIPSSMQPLLAGVPFLLMAVRQSGAGVVEIRFLLLTSLLAAVAFLGAYLPGLADIRFFPFAQLTLAIALGASVALVLARWGERLMYWSLAFITLILVNVWLSGMDRIDQWSRWNLSGYENKALWPHYRDLAQHLAGPSSAPRVIFEHHPANRNLGSTRAMEALPLFGSRPVLEGLYMEASISGPFIYQLQAEISQHPSSPLSRFPAVKGVQGDIAERLQDFYVDTVVVRSLESRNRLTAHPEFEHSATFGPFSVFRLRQMPQLIEVTHNLEPVGEQDNWLQYSFQRYLLDGVDSPRPVLGMAPLPTIKPKTGLRPAEVDLLSFSDEHIRFKTTRPGEPHLIRITYHPAWRSLKGETIYRVGPAFMLIVPSSTQVDLEFDQTQGQVLGKWFSLAGLLLLVINPLSVPRLSHGEGQWQWIIVGTLIVLLGGVAYHFHPSRVYSEAQALHAQEAFSEAALAFDAAWRHRKVSAHQAEALFWAGRSHESAGSIGAAKQRYERLLARHPHNYWAPETLYRLILLYQHEGNELRASQSVSRLLAQFPNNRWAQRWRENTSVVDAP